MKGLFAAIVIVAVGMLSFLMTYDDTEDRIALTSGTLASAIFYHMTLTASIPPVGYLTYADKFMMLQYVFITMALAVSVTLFLLVGTTRKARNLHALAKKVHKATRWSIPLAWVAAMIVLHVLSFAI
jgi:heme/copper-type cytochrome/quinol oxidase subunit 2